MSYLLEALRKSERERQEKSPVPSLQTPTVEWESAEDGRARSPWLMVAVLAICLNTVLLALLVWRFGFAGNAPEGSATLDHPVPVSATGGGSAAPVTAPAPAVIVVQSPRDPASAIVVRERDVRPVEPTAPVSAGRASVAGQVTVATDLSRPEPTAVSNTDPSGQGEAGSRASEPAAADTDAAEPVSIHALPLALRQQLPMLTMNSHIYASNARDSFVMINGSAFAPGQTISADLTLVAVVPEGAILDFRGQRFLLPALASFSP